MDPSYAYVKNLTNAKPPGLHSADISYRAPVGPTEDGITGLDWKDGVGTLPGSDLKFRRNEHGEIEVIMDGITDMPQNGGDTVFTPLPERVKEEPNISRSISTGWSDIGRPPMNVPNGNFYPDQPISANSLGFSGVDEKAFHSVGRYNKPMNGMGPPPPLLSSEQHKVETIDSRQGRDEAIPQVPEFTWARYLKEQNAIAAPESLFSEISGRNPFPAKMKFAVGDLLESVDPLHQSLMCVVSVVEVKGCRMRVHFEGYSTLHDFWVDSNERLIFPCGFCEKTGRKLQPPKDSDPSTFQWSTYANATAKTLAVEEKFCDEYKRNFSNNSKFTIGDKLEAVDRQNPELTCVATVTDIIDDLILIHFDGWNHNFDYWCDRTSNYIHPIGWCRTVGKSLAVPHHYLEVDNFSWARYLKETESKAAPEEAFAPRKSNGFEIGMRLEVVDKRNPILIRVATVAEKSTYRIKIHFDGWDKIYDYWIDVDSPDLHPIEWCTRTGHSLQPNVVEDDRQAWQGGCPVPGCRGLGHIKGSKFVGHHSEYGCPYSSKNLDSYPIQDRITPRRGPKPTSLMSRRMVSVTEKEKTSGPADNDKKRPISHRRASKNSFVGPGLKERNGIENHTPVPTPPYFDEEPPEKRGKTVEGVLSDGGKRLYYSLYSSSLWSSVPNKQLAVYWEQCTRLLPGLKGIRGADVCKWTANEVAKFVENLTGQEKYGLMFLNEEIDGEAFLLLTQNDIFKVMKIKLGPTLKIHGAILYARANE